MRAGEYGAVPTAGRHRTARTADAACRDSSGGSAGSTGRSAAACAANPVGASYPGNTAANAR